MLLKVTDVCVHGLHVSSQRSLKGWVLDGITCGKEKNARKLMYTFMNMYAAS
jgi:hypothetical protein